MKILFRNLFSSFKDFYSDFKHTWYFHLLMTVLVSLTIVFIIFNGSSAAVRFQQCFIDIGNFFTGGTTTINDPGTVIEPGTEVPVIIPISTDIAKIKLDAWFYSMFHSTNFLLFAKILLKILIIILQIALVIVPLYMMLGILYDLHCSPNDNKSTYISPALSFYLKRISPIFRLIGFLFNRFCNWFVEHYFYFIVCVLILFFYFNIYSIVLSFLTWYLYLLITVDLGSIGNQLIRLMLDIRPMFNQFTLPFTIILSIVLINFIVKKIAYDRLRHFEAIDTGILNSWGNTILICGFTRTGKTKMLATLAVLKAKFFRQKAFTLMNEIQLKFYGFPFINFEKAVVHGVSSGEIKNLSTCSSYVRRFRSSDPFAVFHYDYQKYGMSYYDQLKEVDLWELLEDYAQLYFIYTVSSSLIFGNLSVSDDGRLFDLGGHYPVFSNEFFDNDTRQYERKHSHILHFDGIRIFKKLIKDNPYAFSFDFGIVCISEVAKELLNSLEKQEMKKLDDLANQKNDGLPRYIEMHGHASTVYYNCFSQFIMDEQRMDKLGIDVRGVCSAIVNIADVPDDYEYTLPLYHLRPLLYEKFLSKWRDELYPKFRKHRQDQSLISHFVRSLSAFVQNIYLKNLNIFGYKKYSVRLSNGQAQDVFEDVNFIITNKLSHGDLYDTAVFRDYFYQMTKSSEKGINDVPSFAATRATLEEMKQTESYFFLDLLDPDWRKKYSNSIKVDVPISVPPKDERLWKDI